MTEAPHTYRRDLPKKLMRDYAEKWDGLPLPRLQLRWSHKPVPKKAIAEEIRISRRVADAMKVPYREPRSWDCFYEMVLPVDRYDIRNEHYETGFILVPISWTRRGGSSDHPPCSNGRTDDPFRDGAHAFWDSKSLNWLPIFVVAPDGAATMKATYHGQPAEWATLASAIEARRAATETGAVHESAVPTADAQNPPVLKD